MHSLLPQRLPLIYPQWVHIAPVCRYKRKFHHVKYRTQHRVRLNIQKMPHPVESNKQKHYKTTHHSIVTHVRGCESEVYTIPQHISLNCINSINFTNPNSHPNGPNAHCNNCPRRCPILLAFAGHSVPPLISLPLALSLSCSLTIGLPPLIIRVLSLSLL